jgi:hypothetical protein
MFRQVLPCRIDRGTGSVAPGGIVEWAQSAYSIANRVAFCAYRKRTEMRHPIMAFSFLASAALCAPAGAQSAAPASALDRFPHRDISNGIISARVFFPGKKGMYQGTRFDHAGVVLHITYRGHDYSQYWFDRYTPNIHDNTRYAKVVSVQHACCAVSGPVEEFEPIGFDATGMGGGFLKIGVGILKRDTDKYSQFVTYPVLNAGKRTTIIAANSARFTQRLQDKETGYGYSYLKIVTLTPGRPRMTIAHVLKNTGDKPIVTTVYDHNFLTLSPGNEHVVIAAPFAMKATLALQPELAQLDGRFLRYVAPIPDGVTVTSPITGFGDTAADYDFHVTNAASGLGVRMRNDQPIARINFWSVHTVLGWEPYIAISLKPGEVKRWTNTYDYYSPADGPKSPP